MPVSLVAVLVIVFAYLVGSLSGSLLLGRLRGVDIRTQGSGNAGGTNALRTQGWKFALGVVAVDIGKGALAAAGALYFAPASGIFTSPALAYVAVLAAAIGHVWPLWHGFRGGKGVGTLLGGMLVLWPAVLPWLLLIWILVLVGTGYVGLASVMAVLGLLPLAWLSDASATRWLFACVAATLLVYTHRGNLQRLRAGTESRFERARLWRRRS